MRKNKLIAVIAWTIVVASGCPQNPDEFNKFRKLPEAEQARVLKQMPIDEQLDYHMLALGQEPPNSRLATVIASQGDKIIAPAIKRMKAANDDGEKHHVIALFEEYCRVQGWPDKADLFQEIQRAIDSMQDPSWKRMSQRSLDFMKEKSK